jgi:FdhE protein
MTEPAPRFDPIPIGEIAQPPFVRLPAPATLYQTRAARFRRLSEDHTLLPYLRFLAAISDVQHRLQDGLALPDVLTEEATTRSRQFGMPPLDRNAFAADTAFTATLERLLALADSIEMPAEARAALGRIINADGAAREAMVRDILADAVSVEHFADHLYVAAALQVHFARRTALLDAKKLGPVGDGACPACGGPPVASMVVGWTGALNTRFCACSLCSTLWNYPRIKCTLCGSTKDIAYQEIAGGQGSVKAETCDSCRGYVKILHQHSNPSLDPVADDVATLALDLLLRDAEYRRGAVNPFVWGY